MPNQIGDPLDPITVPDVIEPLVGYRRWSLHQDDVYMTAVNLMEGIYDRGVPYPEKFRERITYEVRSTYNTRWEPGGFVTAECHASQWDPWTVTYYALMGDESRPSEPNPCTSSPSHPDHVDIHGGAFGCGIYAYSSWDEAWQNFVKDSSGPLSPYIYGEVQLWGECWTHEAGYRGQYAKPSAFYKMGRCDPAVIEELGEKYEVPVVDCPMGEEERESWKKKTSPTPTQPGSWAMWNFSPSVIFPPLYASQYSVTTGTFTIKTDDITDDDIAAVLDKLDDDHKSWERQHHQNSSTPQTRRERLAKIMRRK